MLERLVRPEDADRGFDIEYWQTLGDAKIFAAAWDLVVTPPQFEENMKENPDFKGLWFFSPAPDTSSSTGVGKAPVLNEALLDLNCRHVLTL